MPRTTFATAVRKMLLSKRRVLLDKQFAETITPDEEQTLAAVREGLDEIEMAVMEPAFARLEAKQRRDRELSESLFENYIFPG